MKDINLTNIWKDFAIFPCKANDKKPATQHGFLDAKTGQDVMKFISSGYNVGLACAQSNVLVLDLDYHDKNATPVEDLKALEDKLGKLPKTLTQASASGNGRHLIFSSKGITTKPLPKIGNYIDTRYNGYIVIAPSKVNNNYYKIIDGIDSNGKPIIAELPQTWIDYLDMKGIVCKQNHSNHKEIKRKILKGNFQKLYEQCAFIKHCVDNSETLSELDWFRFACILNDFENGYEIFDEFSQNYPTYNFEETRKKFENAKKYFVNCNTIKSTFSECSKCKHRKEY